MPFPVDLIVQRLGQSTHPTTGSAGAALAAIDVGSNSIHMIVVAPEANGAYRVLGREREMVRLGRSAFGLGGSGGDLSDQAMEDGLLALVKMITLAGLRGAGQIVAVATSAVREAGNGEEFLARVRAQTGIEVQRLSGEDEGALIYRAVREVVDLGAGDAGIIDVGGGSTEWVATRGGDLVSVASLKLGSLRCAAALAGDPPSPRTIARLRRTIRDRLKAEVPKAKISRLVATSGTAVCCADLIAHFLAQEKTAAPTPAPRAAKSGIREVKLRDLAVLVERLARMPRAQIAALPPVGPPRAESLLAGAILIEELVRHAGVSRFLVSDRALREGLVLAALGQPIPRGADPDDLRRRQVLRLAERTESVHPHSLQTARLAVRLFDLTASLHGLGRREREWLEYAALLHDIGYSIHYQKHHEHSFYLIQNAALDAFDPSEVEIVARVARFHRGASPTPKHPALAGSKPWQQKTIRILAALLRVADALDRTHASRVEQIYCSIRPKRVKLEVISPYAVDLELDAAIEHGRLFEKVFERRLSVRQGLEAAEL
ncbi:MAG TPA: Ppx/GppA phosphatase family protein [Thermoanaerobaculia bacterium]|nr:Ppx/GppA phosphatase family protein [Thermoanaerobaculia bacterium]